MSDSEKKDARGKLRAEIANTKTIQDLVRFIDQQPSEIFLIIAHEHEQTKMPVPDHRLGPINSFTEIILRALMETGLIEQAIGRHIIRAYVPTAKGLELYQDIRDEAPKDQKK